MNRMKVLWHVLIGRPTIYRIDFGMTSHLNLSQPHVLVVDCSAVGRKP